MDINKTRRAVSLANNLVWASQLGLRGAHASTPHGLSSAEPVAAHAHPGQG